MKLFNQMFRQPYLDEPNDLGGGSSEPLPNSDPTPSGDPNPIPQGGNEPPQTPVEQMFKLKYNHEEKEIPYSQAVELAQKGMNYEKAIEKAKQEERQAARDSFYAEQNYEWKGKKINTEAEYKQAMQESQREKDLIAKGIDPNTLEHEVNEHPAVKAAREQEQKNKVFAEFEAWHLDNKESVPDIKNLPQPVVDAFLKSESMIHAFMDYEYKAQKEAKAKETEAAKIQAANEKNAEGATGSVKSGAPAQTFFTQEQVSKMSQKEVDANYKNIMASAKKW